MYSTSYSIQNATLTNKIFFIQLPIELPIVVPIVLPIYLNCIGFLFARFDPALSARPGGRQSLASCRFSFSGCGFAQRQQWANREAIGNNNGPVDSTRE